MLKKYLILLLSPFVLYSQSYLISDVPLPKSYVQNLDPYECDKLCLQEYINNDLIFSFLAHSPSKLKNKKQNEIRLINISILNIGSYIKNKEIKIALLLPYKKIGRYVSSTTNASFSYLMAKNRFFKLKSYKIDSENKKDIQKVLHEIIKDEFHYVIAPLTQKGALVVADLNPNINIFFPTINKQDIITDSSSLYFGGIDYKAQSELLIQEANTPLVIFYDKSRIGQKLCDYEEEAFNSEEISFYSEDYTAIDKSIIKFSIPRRTTNLKRQLYKKQSIQEGSFFLNTPIIKSGMVISQLTLYDVNTTNILSTQVNYDPLILSMTQYQDREKMIIANSITQENNVLIETNLLLGNDIVYDWINYTTTVGVDYFFHLLTKEAREYNIEIEDNQMLYSIELLQPSKSKFIPYKPSPKRRFN
jgi:hypothetical protein